MRKIISVLLIFWVLLGVAPEANAVEQQKIVKVFIDNLPVNFDVQPVIQQGRTLVPFRAISEALNISVAWDGNNKTITAIDTDKTIVLQIGSNQAQINGILSSLEVSPVIINGRTLIPLRFFTENMGCDVTWENSSYTVKISSPVKAMTVTGFYALGDMNTRNWNSLFGLAYPNTSQGHTDIVSDIALGWYSLDSEGNLRTDSSTGWQRPDGWEKVLDAANTYTLKTEMVIHLPDRDSTFAALTATDESLNRAISSIVGEAKKYQGVNLDIEGLGWKEKDDSLIVVRENFTRFVRLLSEQLKFQNLRLTLTLHPPNSAFHGYDYKALGGLADCVIVMAHDYGSKPEPVSLVTKAIEMAVLDVAPEKLVLGISVPNETPESLVTKIGLAKRYKLRGISLWRLGLVSEDMWTVLRNNIQAIK